MFSPKQLADRSQLKLAAPRNTLQFELYGKCVEKREPAVIAGGLPLVTIENVPRLQDSVDGIDIGESVQVLDPDGALVYTPKLGDSCDVIRDGYVLAGFEPDDLHNRACLVCSDDQHEAVSGETLVFMGDQYVHGGCLDGFVEALENVWEYTDTLLADQLR